MYATNENKVLIAPTRRRRGDAPPTNAMVSGASVTGASMAADQQSHRQTDARSAAALLVAADHTGDSWRSRVVGRSLGPAADRAIERGQALIAAAGRLVQRNGEDFTMQEVALEAGLSLRAIYQYFAGKDELLIALIEESGAVLVRLVNRAIEPYVDPLDRLAAALYFMTDARQHTDHEYNATMSRFVARTWASEPDQLGRARRAVTELLADLIGQASGAGSLEPGDVADQAAHVAYSLNAYQMNAHLGSSIGVPLPPNLAFVRYALLGLGAQIPIGWEKRFALADAEARRRRQTSERMAFATGSKRTRGAAG
jgi:AcrR family transcriptional regulator